MKKQVILLIEDNQADVALIIKAFQTNKVLNEIVVASDGIEALDYLFCRGPYIKRDCTNQPQLIILDLKMPKMDGFEVLQAIRNDNRTRFLPVTVLTVSLADDDRIKSYDLGANSFIRKPMNFDKLVEAMNGLGLYWLKLNVAP